MAIEIDALADRHLQIRLVNSPRFLIVISTIPRSMIPWSGAGQSTTPENQIRTRVARNGGCTEWRTGQGPATQSSPLRADRL
jgi:hypothetical protein